MPMFYINPRFGNETIKDGEGKDLPCLQEAKSLRLCIRSRDSGRQYQLRLRSAVERDNNLR